MKFSAFPLLPLLATLALATPTAPEKQSDGIIGARSGSYPGMLTERTFQIVFIAKGRPFGFSFTPRSDETIRYQGNAIAVPLR